MVRKGIAMKNISNYNAEKYETENYVKKAEGIYRHGDYFVTSLSFEQEPELEEGDSPDNISQYPLEDILDTYRTHISDFYNELNRNSETLCYQEFAARDMESIQELREMIGKHVYNAPKEVNGKEYITLVVE